MPASETLPAFTAIVADLGETAGVIWKMLAKTFEHGGESMIRGIKLVGLFLAMVCLWSLPALAIEHTKDSLTTVQEGLRKETAVLLDVREKNEWDAGHLEQARFVPLTELKKGAKDAEYVAKLAKDVPKDKVVYCHCRSGKRAITAGDILKELGYDVRPLAAGYEDLLKAGFPPAKK